MTEDRFTTMFDELNTVVTGSITESLDETDIDKKKKKIADDIESELYLAYIFGVSDASEQLGATPNATNFEKIYNVINMKIDGKTFRDRIYQHIDDAQYGMIKTVAETEYHRVFNTAAIVTAGAIKRLLGNDGVIVKMWETYGDDRVRETHEFIDGVKVGLDEYFYTFDGDRALFPGDFEDASNNVNCRCVLKFKYMNSEILKTQNE